MRQNLPRFTHTLALAAAMLTLLITSCGRSPGDSSAPPPTMIPAIPHETESFRIDLPAALAKKEPVAGEEYVMWSFGSKELQATSGKAKVETMVSEGTCLTLEAMLPSPATRISWSTKAGLAPRHGGIVRPGGRSNQRFLVESDAACLLIEFDLTITPSQAGTPIAFTIQEISAAAAYLRHVVESVELL